MRISLGILLLLVQNMYANPRLPEIFSDGMVVQRNSNLKIWGWGTPKEPIKVSVSWSDATAETVVNSFAYWEVRIPVPDKRGLQTINIKGYSERILKDILIGEVWLCSGQSNMEMTFDWGEMHANEVANDQNNNIRFFTVEKAASDVPQQQIPGKWEAIAPETIRSKSATAYFFAKRLQAQLGNVPIGVIVSAWGGTPLEVWAPKSAVDQSEVLRNSAANLKPSDYCPHQASVVYNAMIHPMVGFPVAGVLWYQGESNVGNDTYASMLKAFFDSWRQAWKADFQVYVVQLAPYNYDGDVQYGTALREQQRLFCEQYSGAHLAVISDAGDAADIHPRDKKTVGERLATLALVNHYKTLEKSFDNPIIRSVRWEKKAVVLEFDPVFNFLQKTGTAIFEAADASGTFVKVPVKVSKNTLIISCKFTPTMLRYGWQDEASASIFSSQGMPLSGFSLKKS